jgi:hypothetical protein
MGIHDTTSDGWTPITRERIRAELEAFVEWETDDRSEVLKTSAALFVVEMSNYAATVHEATAALFCDGPTVPVERVIDVAHRAALRATTGFPGEREFWDEAVIAAAAGFAGSRGYRDRPFPDLLVDDAVIVADALLQARRERWAREGWMREEGRHETV